MPFERLATIMFNFTAGASLVLAVVESSPAWAVVAIVSTAAQFYPDVLMHEALAEGESEDGEQGPPKEG